MPFLYGFNNFPDKKGESAIEALSLAAPDYGPAVDTPGPIPQVTRSLH